MEQFPLRGTWGCYYTETLRVISVDLSRWFLFSFAACAMIAPRAAIKQLTLSQCIILSEPETISKLPRQDWTKTVTVIFEYWGTQFYSKIGYAWAYISSGPLSASILFVHRPIVSVKVNAWHGGSRVFCHVASVSFGRWWLQELRAWSS